MFPPENHLSGRRVSFGLARVALAQGTRRIPAPVANGVGKGYLFATNLSGGKN
jgi:hypothetical protein